METKTRTRLPGKQIIVAGGYLLLLARKQLYITYDPTGSDWSFSVCEWAPKGIKQISATNDGNYLWILADKGYIYQCINGDYLLQRTLKTENYRLYGNTLDQYYEYDPDNCCGSLMPYNKKVMDACEGVFDHSNNFVPLKRSDRQQFQGVRLINWAPKYL